MQSNTPAGVIDVLNAGAFDDCNQDETFYLVIAVLYASGSSCGDWSLELRGENGDVSRLCGADD